ncbi:unnamed protein product [Lasius platythorax]|uniref:Longitudinals lacking isoforms a b d l n=3 Tax=Lasius TaxID=488720 RepID=A0A0J7L361_LASNI|nr:longitudinals lacking isoforms a b d l [Lasius niger]
MIAAWPSYRQYYRDRASHHKVACSSNYANPKASQRPGSYLDKKPGSFQCPKCGKEYRWLRNMKNHLKVECGKEPKECCPYCSHRTKYKSSLQKHILRIHFS